jgi:hypothetical protein
VILAVHYVSEIGYLAMYPLFATEAVPNLKGQIWAILTMRAGYDLLPFYVVVVALAPGMLELLRRRLWWVLGGVSLGLFTYGQWGNPWALAFPNQQAFLPILWQGLFVAGMLGGAALPWYDALARRVKVGLAALAVVAHLVLFVACYGPDFGLYLWLPMAFAKVPLTTGEALRYLTITLALLLVTTCSGGRRRTVGANGWGQARRHPGGGVRRAARPQQPARVRVPRLGRAGAGADHGRLPHRRARPTAARGGRAGGAVGVRVLAGNGRVEGEGAETRRAAGAPGLRAGVDRRAARLVRAAVPPGGGMMSLTVATLTIVTVANLEQKQLAKWYTSKRHSAPMSTRPYTSEDGQTHQRQPWDGGPLPGDDATPDWVEDPDDEVPDTDEADTDGLSDSAASAFGGPTYGDAADPLARTIANELGRPQDPSPAPPQ